MDVYEREGKLGRAHDFARITLAGIRLFKDDEMAVVECNFRVHGTTNLSVVDASVFPPIPGFFIVTAVYMISEKASDVILAGATVGPGFVKRMFRRVTRRGTLG